MRITSLKIRNLRTLESIDLSFSSSYAAICGANDSGKTNVIRAIRALMKAESAEPITFYRGEEELSLKDDFPKWKDTEPSKREISIEISIELDEIRDTGFYQFVVKQLSIKNPENTLCLSIAVSYCAEKNEPTVLVKRAGHEYSDLDAQEVLKKLQSSRSILIHNSTELASSYMYPVGRIVGHIREITGQHESLVASMKKTVSRGLAKISRAQQAEFERLLGRLQTKYKVGLSLPAFDFSYLPFSITLSNSKYEIPLDDWGSGTKNRTLVLLALFRARQIGDSEPSAGKITPVIIIEEPESFLHPSAQAEFGRVLQDLAEEFQVQVLVTTHSPYLLNLKDPTSNILLRRRSVRRQMRDTECVDTTGDNWMAPFSQALGLDTDELKPWKAMVLANSETILLVEGKIDKEYFEMLRDASHGSNRLLVESDDIVPYQGTGALSNTILLNFIKNRFRRFFVTFDLDAEGRIEKILQSLGLEKRKHYLPIGLNAPGKKSIEGLLPDVVKKTVYGENPNLVEAATSGTNDEQKRAKNHLKELLLNEFKKQAVPGNDHFKHFYSLTKVINKALA